MARIDFLVFGYRKLKISPEDISEATSILLRNGLSSRINPDGTISVRERDIAKIRGLLSGRIEFSVSETLGVAGAWLRFDHKIAMISSLLISIVMLLLLSSVVWDVRAEGNEKIPDSEIIYRLSECGFSIGDFWQGKNLAKIENTFLANYDDISWININRRGTVAYITLIEKEAEVMDEDTNIVYSNILATADCVIEEITVKSGLAMVKVGDAVKKGDLLILGAKPAEAGGGFCQAEGQVIGRVSDSISVSVDRKYEICSITGRKICSVSANFFKFSINIFNLYGNLTSGCDIIEDEKEYSLLGGPRLPFSLTLEYMPLYDSTRGEYTDDELVSIARDRLSLATALRLYESDLITIRTWGEFTDSGYEMFSDIVFLSDVGEENSFDLE